MAFMDLSKKNEFLTYEQIMKKKEKTFDDVLARARRVESLILWNLKGNDPHWKRLKDLLFFQLDGIKNICKDELGYSMPKEPLSVSTTRNEAPETEVIS
jgi:hypothetical protein